MTQSTEAFHSPKARGLEIMPNTCRPFRVLVAPDKFKGCLSAIEVAEALRSGMESTSDGPAVSVTVLPLADGGDGSVAAAGFAGSRLQTIQVHGAHGHVQEAQIAFDGRTAVVEVAATCGLATLGGSLRPLTASSRGLGEAIRAAAELKPESIVVALGGSASTDGGAGMLAALGAEFRDAEGKPVEPDGGSLGRIVSVNLDRLMDFGGTTVIGASDVTNPLLGDQGAARVFGPQKGADAEMVAILESGLGALVDACEATEGIDANALAVAPGAGSAGGIGFGLMLLGGSLVSGAGYFLDLLHFDSHAQRSDVVVTGEGCLDAQTSDGKLISAVCARAGNTPVWAAVGTSMLDAEQVRDLGLSGVVALRDVTRLDTSQDPLLAKQALEQVGRDIVHAIGVSSQGQESLAV